MAEQKKNTPNAKKKARRPKGKSEILDTIGPFDQGYQGKKRKPDKTVSDSGDEAGATYLEAGDGSGNTVTVYNEDGVVVYGPEASGHSVECGSVPSDKSEGSIDDTVNDAMAETDTHPDSRTRGEVARIIKRDKAEFETWTDARAIKTPSKGHPDLYGRAAPQRGYLLDLRTGKIHALLAHGNKESELTATVVRKNQVHDVNLKGRTPVFVYGSALNAGELYARFDKAKTGGTIISIPAHTCGRDAVYANFVSKKGYIPAQLEPAVSPDGDKAVVVGAVLLLTDKQIKALASTETNYSMKQLPEEVTIDVGEADWGPRLSGTHYFAANSPPYKTSEGELVAVETIRALTGSARRVYSAMSPLEFTSKVIKEKNLVERVSSLTNQVGTRSFISSITSEPGLAEKVNRILITEYGQPQLKCSEYRPAA